MVYFILFTLSYISGMALSALLDIHGGAFFLLLSVFLGVGAFIPFWQRNALALREGNISSLLKEEESVPVLTIMFLLGTFCCFGIYQYSAVIYSTGPNHIDKLMEGGDPWTKFRVVGEIVEEPNLKNDYLEVKVKPRLVQKLARTSNFKERKPKKGRGRRKKKGAIEEPAPEAAGAETSNASGGYTIPDEPEEVENPVDGGLVMAMVYQETEAFRKVKFNQTVELIGQFNKASARRNPGSLDYQKFLRNQGIFRTIRLTEKSGKINILGENPDGSRWYRFALYLRMEFLKVVKQTMPYPESSFLGGVMLGLRGGLPNIITTEFRKTGVSHVLAVSGLHVTIIAGLLFGIFTVFRVPPKVFGPIIVFFLFTFALIVGWPSSAVRAALMNSLFVLSRAYLKDSGFRMSIVFSLSVAAAYILFMSPLQLTEPSFVLSFMAIYSLAMFTDPIERLLRQTLRGNGLALITASIFIFFLTVAVKRDLVLQPLFFHFTVAYIIGSLWLGKKLSAGSDFQSYSFEMLPGWLKSFTAAQVAIFLAMMGPLSAFYFGTMSLAAPLANMIAIPLIGVIVQLGMIAGIAGTFVPAIGLHLALVINAANWLGVKFFLGMAHFFATLIPFPRISQPGIGAVFLYYAILHLFFHWEVIYKYTTAIGSAASELWEDPDYKLSLGLLGGLAIGCGLFLSVFGLSRLERQPSLRATLLDVGYGSSLLLEKGGKTALIDAAMRDGLSEYDVGERVIQPALSEKGVDKIDVVVLSSALPERISGLMIVSENYQIGKILAPFDIPTDGKLLSFPDFVRRFTLADMKMEADFKKGIISARPPDYYWDQAFSAFNALIKRVNSAGIPVGRIKEGSRLPGFEDCIECLYPPKAKDPERFSAYYDGAILKITEAGMTMLYTPGNMYPLQKIMPQKVDMLFLAELPYPLQNFLDLMTARRFDRAAMSFRKPSSWLLEGYYMKKILDGRGIQLDRKTRDLSDVFYRTDTDGAVQVDVFKNKISVKRFIESPTTVIPVWH